MLFCSLTLCSRAQEAPVDAEVAVTPKNVRKRKTTHSDLTHGSFFLRVGAIGKPSTELSTSDSCLNWSLLSSLFLLFFPPFPVLLSSSPRLAFGLGAMIYIGLEFGSFFEIPFDSPCHHILIGVNPLLQMIFTFMQMYFIFMNARVSPFSSYLGRTLQLISVTP